MKARILLIVLLTHLKVHNAQAQSSSPVFAYAEAGFGAGTHEQFKCTLDFLVESHHTIALGFNSYWRRSPQIPDNTRPTTDGFRIIPYPQEVLNGFTITYGYVIYPTHYADRLRYNLRGGLLFGNFIEPNNVVFHGDNYGGYYTNDSKNYFTTALLLQPTVEIATSPAFGFTGGLFTVLSSKYSGAGVSLGILLGKVSNKPRRLRHKVGHRWRLVDKKQ